MQSSSAATADAINPRRYFDHIAERGPLADVEPVCLYLETTNRCNLLCTTCPRTFEALEPPADMGWDLFTRIVDQFPRIARVILHGVGEPMMVPALPRMIRYLKGRGVYVLFNTNGTLLTRRKGQELIDSGLDELRVSLDAAEPQAFKMVRGRDMFGRIARNIRAFRAMQREQQIKLPRVSLWLTGLKETVRQLNDFVRLARDLDVEEVYLQRLVYFRDGQGLARPESALFADSDEEENALVRDAEALAAELGIRFNASGATDPAGSLTRQQEPRPWSLCRRPWTLMYFTAHGRAIPCCIAPFSIRGYDGFTLGDATQQSLREIWNGPQYQAFRSALLSDRPPPGLLRMRVALEPLSVSRPRIALVIPTLNEAAAIGGVLAGVPRGSVDEIIVADSASTDGTDEIARQAGARVLTLRHRGYGRACRAGAEAARDCDIVVFLDGDGSDCPELIPQLVAPIADGRRDFVIGSRTRGERERGSMTPHQILAGRVLGAAVGLLYGVRYTDMSPFRAIRRDTLMRLGMREETYGWNLEMQMRAAGAGLRIAELPVAHRRRAGGASKVSGNLRGTIKASWRILATFVRIALELRGRRRQSLAPPRQV